MCTADLVKVQTFLDVMISCDTLIYCVLWWFVFWPSLKKYDFSASRLYVMKCAAFANETSGETASEWSRQHSSSHAGRSKLVVKLTGTKNDLFSFL